MAIKSNPPFDLKSFLGTVGEGRSLARYRKGQTIISQGEPADAVFFIQKGKVKLTVGSPQGKEAVVGILETDGFFGEGCLAGQRYLMVTVTALTDASIVRLEKTA